MTWKGKVWQMTLAYVGHIVWTNEDMLAKYNLKHPTTYAEWQAMCDTLKSNKETPIFYAAKPQTALNRLASQVEMTVGRPKHPNFWADLLVTGKADFTTPEWIESFKRAKDFVDQVLRPGLQRHRLPDRRRPVRHRQVRDVARGLVLGRRHHGRQAGLPEARRVQRAVRPTTPTPTPSSPVYGDIGWAGLKYTKSPDMVMEWIDFFGQKENFQSFMQVLQYYPTQTVELTGPCRRRRRRCSRRPRSRRSGWPCRA